MSAAKTVLLDVARWVLSVDRSVQVAYFGDDVDNALYRAGYLVFRHDDKIRSSESLLLNAPPSLLALPSPSVAAIFPAAPSLELVLETRSALMSIDLDKTWEVDPMTAVDIERELDWCDSWLEQYRRYRA